MASLTIKNVPDMLYKRLKIRAKMNNRSINGEILNLLKNELGFATRDVERIINEAREVRSWAKGSLSEEEIRKAIQEGRE